MDFNLQEFGDKVIPYAENIGSQYCDVRIEDILHTSALIENGETEFVKTKIDSGIGIRIIKNGVWGFCAITNPKTFEQIRDKVDQTVKITAHYSKNKKNHLELFKSPVKKLKKNFPVVKKPDPNELIKIGLECNRIIMGESRIIQSSINAWYTETSKYFKNSEGSETLQNFTDVVIDMTATAHESGLTQSVNITEGGRGGMEQILAYDKAQKSASNISKKAAQLIDAKPIKEEKATVVMNPDFVSLLTHEILGHPSEADRVLGKEMAWAGGAWWKGKLGEKIGSETLNVFDDPTIKESLGWYYFDDEGVETKKQFLLKKVF